MIYHPANKTTYMEDWMYSYTVKDHARCNGFASDPVYSIKKPTFRQLGSTKIQKTALCCLLFHKSFPYSLPFCGLDWLCYTQCANVQEKPNGSHAQKHYPALWWARGPAHPVHISHRRPTIPPTFCVCNHADESRGRLAGQQVRV